MTAFWEKITAPLRPDERSRRIAEAMLSENGTRLHLILAALVCLVLSLGTLYLTELVLLPVPWRTLYDHVPTLYALFDTLYYLIEIALFVFVILPLVFGLSRIFYVASEGKRLPLFAMFSPFRDGRSYRRATSVMLLLALPRALAFLFLHVMYRQAEGHSLWLRLLIYALAILLAAALSLLLTLDDAVLALALADDSLPLRVLWRTSAQHCYDRMFPLFRFKLGFLGWGVLSALSLGTVLLCHVLPLYALAHRAYTDADAPCIIKTETSIAPKGKTI